MREARKCWIAWCICRACRRQYQMPDLISSHDELAQATKAHLEATGIEAISISPRAASFLRCEFDVALPNAARVAIIVPTRDRVDLLRTCIESVERSAPDVDKEIIIVDNNSSDPETKAYLQRAAARGVKVLEVPGPFNYSRLINRAVATHVGRLYLSSEQRCPSHRVQLAIGTA